MIPRRILTNLTRAQIMLSSLLAISLLVALPASIYAQGSGVDPGFDGVPFDPDPEIPEFNAEKPEGGLGESSFTQEDIRDLELYETLAEYVTFFSIGIGIILGVSAAYTGLVIINSNGNPGKLAEAVERMRYILLAMVLYIFAYAIFQWLVPGGIL